MVSKNILFPVLSFAVVALALGLWAISHADREGKITVCVNPAGLLRLKASDGCKKNESALSWNGQQQKGGQLHLYDGNNQDLGVITEKNLSQYETYLPDKELALIVQVFSSHKLAVLSRSFYVFFDEPNCQGNAYGGNVHGQYPYEISRASGGRFFKGTDDFVGAIRTIKSETHIAIEHHPDNGIAYDFTMECNNQGPEERHVYKLQEIDAPFSEPLVWPPRIVSE
jgi:hypothetical protein